METKTSAQYCIYRLNNVFDARNPAYHRWSISYIFSAPWILICLSLQFAAAFLGEHSEEPSLHFRRARERGRGRLFVRHSSDLHGRLHENRAQTQSGKCLRISYRHIKTCNTSFIDFLSLSLLPPGFSQQQITLCKGDLHLQKDGRRVSAPALHSLSLQPNAHIWFTDCLMLVVHKNGENFLNMIWLTGFMQYLVKSVIFISPPGIKCSQAATMSDSEVELVC